MKKLQCVTVAEPAKGLETEPVRAIGRRPHRRLPGGWGGLLQFSPPFLSRLLRRHLWRFSPCIGLLFLLAGLNQASGAALEVSKEAKLEAVLLFNLARFVDWPPEAFATTNAPLVIGILGRDPFGPTLEEVVRGELANGHPLRVKHCSTVHDAAECQIVFVSSSERSRAKAIVSDLKARPVLTVSDVEAFCRSAGGMVAFYVNEQHRIRVRLNLEAAKTAGLNVSSKLIQVAELERSHSSMNCGPGTLASGRPAVVIPFAHAAQRGEPLRSATAALLAPAQPDWP